MKPSQFFRDLPNGRSFHAAAIGKAADRKPAIVDALEAGQASIFIGGYWYPLEGHVAAVEEIADCVGL